MARIALVSDVHLGTQQYGLKERYEDFLESFRRFGADVVKEKPDAVIIGGDLFDSSRPDAKEVFCAQQVVGRIKAAGIPVFGIDGNHDLVDGYWLRTIGAERLLESETVDIEGTHVSGMSFRSGQDFVDTIRDMGERRMKVDVLVAHFALAEIIGGRTGTADASVQELTPLLKKLGCKFVLMGHVHITDVHEWNGITFVNPGSTEMKSAQERNEKFWMLVDTDSGEVKPIPLKTRPVEFVDIATEDDMASFTRRIERESRRDPETPAVFYHVIANNDIHDAFNRLAKIVHDNSALARIAMRAVADRDVVPAADGRGSVATLESAILDRFPKESDEARLASSVLHSPEPSAIHLIINRFMCGEKGLVGT